MAAPTTATPPATLCTFRNGTVPWVTLGLSADDAVDAWGRKISYRVYDGPTGMTQALGASMSDCDTVEPAPGAVCTSPVQTYLDLSIAGERGAEAAAYLRQQKLSWPTSHPALNRSPPPSTTTAPLRQ